MLTDDAFFEALRSSEYARLDRQGVTYLDYAGSAVFAASQLDAHRESLLTGLYGNPHSDSAPSQASTQALDDAREAVLRHFGVSSSSHLVCFTANASAAIKLVAEGFPFANGRGLLLASDNHNSINGVREFARRAGARVEYVGLDAELRLQVRDGDQDGGRIQDGGRVFRPGGAGLFAFPAQSNFSGVKHPLSLVAKARAAGWRVLLDAASFAPTNALDLSACEADFVPISFYKMFGYPTGLGALIARRDAVQDLRRPWFAGGTVDYVSVQHGRHQLRSGHEAFEDGTANFLAALSVPTGLEFLARVGQPRLAERIQSLTGYFLKGLQSIRHADGRAAMVLYGPNTVDDRGGVVAFNVTGDDGNTVPYWSVESSARESNLALRGGCFCNPGAAEAAFGFDPNAKADCFAKLGSNFSVPAFASCLGTGTAVGALRVSVGVPTTQADLDRALDFLRKSVAGRASTQARTSRSLLPSTASAFR
jgi:selenocysteine lyase/cysteine desulfurase